MSRRNNKAPRQGTATGQPIKKQRRLNVKHFLAVEGVSLLRGADIFSPDTRSEIANIFTSIGNFYWDESVSMVMDEVSEMLSRAVFFDLVFLGLMWRWTREAYVEEGN